jgi:hypothetical protein
MSATKVPPTVSIRGSSVLTTRLPRMLTGLPAGPKWSQGRTYPLGMTEVPGDDLGLIRQALTRLAEGWPAEAPTVIRWDVINGSSTHRLALAAGDGRWELSDGAPAWSDLAVALDVDDLDALATGRLGAGTAFLSGRLRLSGDLVLAQRLLPGFADRGPAAPTARPDRPGP